MPKAKSEASRTAKRWLFHGILSDTPLSEEDAFLSEAEIVNALRTQLLYPGIRVQSLRLTALPERQKRAKTPEKAGS